MHYFKQDVYFAIPVAETEGYSLLTTVRNAAAKNPDLIEWRLDYLRTSNEQKIDALAGTVRKMAGATKLLLTLRTKDEGGHYDGPVDEYVRLLIAATQIGDCVDVELSKGQDVIDQVKEAAEERGVKVIVSYHDFQKTPSNEEIIQKLDEEKASGCDLCKVAYMSNSYEDTDRLLEVIAAYKEANPDTKIAGISMGEYGKKNRQYAGLFGSSLGFVGLNNRSFSAPGQITIGEMKDLKKGYYSDRRHISLVGFMGAGKSTISEILGEKLGCKVYDTDQYIEKFEKRSISQIFEEEGEAFFRKLETDTIDHLASLKDSVISCGGGLAIPDLNARKLRRMGEVVWLRAKPSTIYHRVKDEHTRPLLEGNMSEEYIENLMEKRREYYERVASIVVDTDDKTPEEIADEIIDRIKEGNFT